MNPISSNFVVGEGFLWVAAILDWTGLIVLKPTLSIWWPSFSTRRSMKEGFPGAIIRVFVQNKELFDKLQDMLFGIWHGEIIMKINQRRSLKDRIFENGRNLLCENVWKSFKPMKSSIESKKLITRWKSSYFNRFVIQYSICICIHIINCRFVIFTSLASCVAKVSVAKVELIDPCLSWDVYNPKPF